tara:strand:+ start:442 stop:858 length:417 start_codon:yes stop_codon:yes gene_type:complete
MTEYLKPLPKIDGLNKPHWSGANEGRLIVQQCTQCKIYRYPFQKMCSSCHSIEVSWQQVSGKGFVWSWCIFHRPYFKGFESEMPYNVILVQLDEGFKIYSNLTEAVSAEIHIGMRVKAHFDSVTEEFTLVKFEKDRND